MKITKYIVTQGLNVYHIKLETGLTHTHLDGKLQIVANADSYEKRTIAEFSWYDNFVTESE